LQTPVYNHLVEILIVGGGIGGLSLALSLHQVGIACRVFEAAPEIRPLGVGINILPHGARELVELGLEEPLARVAVETREMCAINRFGQFIFREPRGRFAGYPWPQWSIHRADLHRVLLEAVVERLGAQAVVTGKKCVDLAQNESSVTLHFVDGSREKGDLAIGCDGIHSALRKNFFPRGSGLVYQGINMWRGVTRCKPFLSGASMIIGGWLEVGKLVVYPIRRDVDAQGLQLMNWVAEIQSPRNVMQDWNLPGKLEHFLPAFESWRFDWLDVPAMIRAAEAVYEYPMVDREPLASWTRGRLALLGDAAHPMYPRGSNGAGQAILDARTLAACLSKEQDVFTALKTYEEKRLKPANEVVLANRSSGPDSILRAVHERTGDRPFERIEDVISSEEIRAISDNYKRVAGFERESLAKRASLL
jgi:2-polyprenyl-6-methoxyphenol hydroxylase-like FAD-dependent oxidoreductase